MHVYSKNDVLGLLSDQRFPFSSDDGSNPFATRDWLRHWVREVASDDWSFYLPTSGRGGARMLLYRDPREPHTLKSTSNFYTILSPATFGASRDSAIEAVRELAGVSGVGVLELRPLDPEDRATLEVERALRSLRWYTRRSAAFGNWHLPCAGMSFDRYLEERPAQLRNTLRRKSKKFPGRIEIFIGGEGLEAAIATYHHVYSQSWKRPEPYAAFVPGWMRICAERGWLRLGIAWLSEAPIAAQFWFVYAGRAHIYKLAYDEAHREHSAGTILTARLMEHVLDVDHVAEVDYGSGDDGYKRDWMTARRERIILTACNTRTLHGALRAARECMGKLTAPMRAMFSSSRVKRT
jgi:hypothetical protein